MCADSNQLGLLIALPSSPICAVLIPATLSVNMSQTEAALGRLEGLIEQLDVKRRMDIETRIFDKHQKARR